MSHEAFLRAIRDRPDDDLPRLVYADFLDDVGDHPRAEFIRVQCELARLPADHPRRPALEDREHELLAEHEPTWVGVPESFGDLDTWEWEAREWECRRGFVDEVRTQYYQLPPADWFDRHPVTRLAVLTRDSTDSDDPASLLRFPWFDRVERLDLSGWDRWGIDELAELIGGDAPRLRHLDLTGLRGIGRLADALDGSALVTRLTSLAFGGRSGAGFRWGDAANETVDVAAFNRALAGGRLESLTAFDSGLTTDGLRWMFAAPWSESLTALDVSDNPLAPDAWRAFRHDFYETRLKRLDVSGTPLAGIALEPLLDQPITQSLTELVMDRCGSARRNMEVLADSRFWTQATELRASAGTIPARALEPLCRSAGPPRLATLDLGHNYLRAEGVRMLCGAPWAASLAYLSLARNYLDDEAAAALAECGRLTRLHTLHLAGNQVDVGNEDPACLTDAGVRALADSPSLARLRTLTLGHTAVTDRGAIAALEGPHWRLARLGLAGCDLSPAFVESLARSPRLARLEWLDLSANPRLSGSALLPLAESPYLSRLCELDVRHVYPDDRVREALRRRLGPRLSE